MNANKKTAAIVGALFLTALFPNIIANEMLASILNNQHYLSHVYPNRHILILSNFLNIICAIAMIFIPIVLSCAVHSKYKNFANGYIVFRGLEGILFLFMAIKSLSFINLSKGSLESDEKEKSFYYLIGSNTHAEIHWATIVYLIVFCSGAMLLYSLLYQSKLVPKWLSAWGLAGVFVLAIGTIMAMFNLGIFKSLPQLEGMKYFAPLIALNELVLSLWLIIKGFNKSIGP